MAFPCQACREYLHLPGLRGPDPHVWPQGSTISLWKPQELRPKCPPYKSFAFSRPFLLFYISPSIFPSMPSLPESFSWPLQGGEVCSAHITHSQSTPFLCPLFISCCLSFSFSAHLFSPFSCMKNTLWKIPGLCLHIVNTWFLLFSMSQKKILYPFMMLFLD